MVKKMQAKVEHVRGWYRYSFMYEVGRRKERFLMWLAYRLPRKLVYNSAIRLMVNATTGEYSHQVVPELTAMDALQRWDK